MRKYPHFRDCKCKHHEVQGEFLGRLSKDNEWWVNSPKYSNCFWVYFRHNNRSHTLSEIAKLLRLSISAITTIEQNALKKIKKRLLVLGVKK